MDNRHFDVVVIGGGPAGSTAALYAARASLTALVIEQGVPGGQIATSDIVDNYPGIPSISGAELGARMLEHAEAAGAEVAYDMVEAVRRTDTGDFEIVCGGGTFSSTALIMATGATPRTVGFGGEDAFRGRGISYCATCDGMFYRNKSVFVVGGGNSAVEEADYLARIASDVTMIVRRDEFRAPRGAVNRLLAHDNVSVRYNTAIARVEGDRLLSSIVFRDTVTGEERREEYPEGSFGVFVFAGNDPAVDLVREYVELSVDGGVVTDDTMQTSTPGLFCVGDMRAKALRQVVTAAADGAIAGTAAYAYVVESQK